MRPKEDPCRCPASEARDDWADALADGIGCRPLAPLQPNPTYVDAPYESYCCKIDSNTGEFVSTIAKSEEEERLFFDPDNLEGPGPTDEERRANARALSKLTVQERFALMFRGPKPDPES